LEAPIPIHTISSREKAASRSAAVFRLSAPGEQTVPLVFASPHSGNDYPAAFAARSRLDQLMLRRSEDAFVDEIYAAAPAIGAPLLAALFPRAYVDPNRQAYELDPEMFEGPLPDHVNTSSSRVRTGLGTIARVVTSGEEIYKSKISFIEAKRRIETLYEPYHAELRRLISETKAKFGLCILIDCHSMPSIGGPMDNDQGLRRVDFVLGDRFATACAAAVTSTVENVLKDMDFAVVRNTPYAGGFTTSHYGRPEDGVHALQIEINRALYMDEVAVERGDGFGALVSSMENVIRALAEMETASL
jgi:N-formylglutamate amidohydrolase